jgi:hypothetical protein
MKDNGYQKFNMHHHTQLWKEKDGKNPNKHYGVCIEGAWYWYDNWIDVVKDHCKKNEQKYK